MKSVKKIFKRRLPPYNLRSRKKTVPAVKTSTPKVNREVQASLSEEENCTLLCELPYYPSSLKASTSAIDLGEEIQSSQPSEPQRYSTAFSDPNQADHTNREAIDISIEAIDPRDEPSIVQPSSSQQATPSERRQRSETSSLEDFSPIDSRLLHSGPRIALEVENISEPSGEKPNSPIQDQETSAANKVNTEEQLINSQKLIFSEVADRINYTKPKQNKKIIRSESLSSSEFRYTQTDSEREYSEDSDEENIEELSSNNKRQKEKQIKEAHNQKPELATMEAATLRELQDQMVNLQTQMSLQRRAQQQTTTALEQVPLPEVVNTRRPPPFHGYDSEDVNRWLDKVENYLTLRRIDLTTPTARAELVTSLAGPAEDFYYSLPLDQKSTYVGLRDSLRERFANDNQSWMIWQAVSTRQQGASESLDTYLTDLTNKFRRLNISDADKMRYFVQGLRPDVRKTVLLRQPKTFREAEEMARLACSVETTMSRVPDGPMSTQLNNLSHALNLLAAGANQNRPLAPFPHEKNLQGSMDRHSAAMEQLTASLGKLAVPEASSKAPVTPNVAYLDGQSEVSANIPASRTEIHHLQGMMEDLRRELKSQGQRKSEITASLAAISEPSQVPDVMRELRRMQDKIEEQYRRIDARINGLARRNREEPLRTRTPEQPRQRTREGQPICYNCGRAGHFQQNCNQRPSHEEFHNSGRFQQNQPRRERYEGYSRSGYTQPQRRDELPSLNTRGPRLAVLDQEVYDDEFVAPLEREGPYSHKTKPQHERQSEQPKTDAQAMPVNTGSPPEIDETIISTQKLLQQIKELENKVHSITKSSKTNNLIDERSDIQQKIKRGVGTMTADHFETLLPGNLEPEAQVRYGPEVDVAFARTQPESKHTSLGWTRESQTPGEQHKKPPVPNAVRRTGPRVNTEVETNDEGNPSASAVLTKTLSAGEPSFLNRVVNQTVPSEVKRKSILRVPESETRQDTKVIKRAVTFQLPTADHPDTPSLSNVETIVPPPGVQQERPYYKDHSDVLITKQRNESPISREEIAIGSQAPFANAARRTGPKLEADEDIDTGSKEDVREPLSPHPWSPPFHSSAAEEPTVSGGDLSHTSTPLKPMVFAADQCNVVGRPAKPRDLTVTAQLNGQDIKMLVDTGAGTSVIDAQFLTEIYHGNLPNLEASSLRNVTTVSGQALPVLGKLKTSIRITGEDYPCELQVVKDLTYEAVLGRDFLRANGAVIDLRNATLQLEDPPDLMLDERYLLRMLSRSQIPNTELSVEDVSPGTAVLTSTDSDMQVSSLQAQLQPDADIPDEPVDLLAGADDRTQVQQLFSAVSTLSGKEQPDRLINTEQSPSKATLLENKNDALEFMKEIRRIENSFSDKIENLCQRVDDRINSFARRKQISRKEHDRRPKPICYKCGLIGHIQYNCYSYNQLEDQFPNSTHLSIASTETATNDQQPQLLPNHEQSANRQRRESKPALQPSNTLLLRKLDAKLRSSDLTTRGSIAGQAVQLLVDTGACVSAIDKQLFTNIFGRFPPKMSEGSLTSVQTVSGDTVPVLGKLTVPLQLNGREYPCEFHVMQNLAYDAILGRNFLQENSALIDLVNSTLSFKGATYPGKQSTNTTTVPVMGTFLPQPQDLKEKNTEPMEADSAPLLKNIESKLAHRRQKNKEFVFQQPLLVLMLVLLYLFTASYTQHTTHSAKPVIQKIPKSFVQRTPDFKVEDVQVNDTSTRQMNGKKMDQSVPNEREAERINTSQSGDVKKTLKSDYSSQLTVDHNLQKEDEKRDDIDAIATHLGYEVPRYGVRPLRNMRKYSDTRVEFK